MVLSKIPLGLYICDLGNVWTILTLAFLGDFSLLKNPSIDSFVDSFENLTKVSSVFLMFSVFARTTNPFVFGKALQALLRKTKIKSSTLNDVIITVQLAIRFFPLVFEEAERIRTAHFVRGGVTNRSVKGVLNRLKAIPLMTVPLLVSSLRKVDRIVTAMEARKFKSSSYTTCYHEFGISKHDLLFALAGLILILLLTT